MFIVDEIEFSSDGKKISYTYTASSEISKYFKKNEPFYSLYEEDISDVPNSFNIIPLLANVMPISWFAGFDIYVNELDKNFYYSLLSLKEQFAKFYPQIQMQKSNLVVKNLIEYPQNNQTKRVAMLFSGGVDSYCTYFRHCDEKLDLITINGADIKLDDKKQFSDFLQYNIENDVISQNLKYHITCNFRDFITFEVDKLLPDLAWWGRVQHGISMTCLLAPLSFLKGYGHIYIASTYTRKENYDLIIWGSMPEIDNLIRYGETCVIHDAAELTRQEKIISIVNSKIANSILILRVCYSDYKVGLNCSSCEKCLRTIIAIMITGSNPNDYGFNVDYSIFSRLNHSVKKGFSSSGNRLFWKEIYEYSTSNLNYYNVDNSLWENEYNSFFVNLQLVLKQPIKKVSTLKRIKLDLINRSPCIFNFYLKIKRKFL